MAEALYTTEQVEQANLLEAAEVVADAIVSKPLVNTEAIRQVVFAMDAGQSISEHRAPYIAVVQVLDGRLRFGVGGCDRELGPHDWLVMPPNEPHDLDAITATRFLLTLVKEPNA